MKKLNVAVCGGSEKEAWMHARAWVNSGNADLFGFCCADSGAAASRASVFGVKALSGFDAALADNAVDAIDLLEFDGRREERALAALAAGKSVLLSAPFAGNAVSAEKIAQAAKGASPLLMSFEPFFFYPPAMKLVEMARKDVVGRITAARFRTIISDKGGWDEYLTPDFKQSEPEAKCERDEIVRRELFEKLSLAVKILGPVAETHFIAPPSEGPGAAILTWKNTAHAIYGCIELNFCPDMEIRSAYDSRDDNVELTGPSGIIWLTRGASQMRNEPAIRAYRGENLFAYGNLDDDWQRGYDACADHFAQSALSARNADIAPAASAAVMKIVDAALKSAANKERVAVSA